VVSAIVIVVGLLLGQASPLPDPSRAETYRVECERGIAAACTAIGALHARWGTRRDSRLARSYFRKACKAGDAQACIDLAVALRAGSGGPIDVNGARALLQRACTKGHGRACWQLAFDPGAPSDKSRGERLAHRACDLGDGEACWWLADANRGSAPEAERAVEIWTAGCDRGTAADCTRLARALGEGKHGIPKDVERARTLAKRACDLGDGGGCERLAALDPGGDASGQQARDALLARACDLAPIFCEAAAARAAPERAPALLERACEAGLRESCHELATRIATKPEGERSPEVASLRRRACELGRRDSCLEAANALAPTVGSRSRAVSRLLRRGCELGDARGCSEYGAHLVTQRRAEAVDFLRMGCRRGDCGGCIRLADVLMNQRAARRNPEGTLRWAQRACSCGVHGPSSARFGLAAELFEPAVRACLYAADALEHETPVERNAVAAYQAYDRVCSLGTTEKSPTYGAIVERACAAAERHWRAWDHESGWRGPGGKTPEEVGFPSFAPKYVDRCRLCHEAIVSDPTRHLAAASTECARCHSWEAWEGQPHLDDGSRDHMRTRRGPREPW
jgi:TPR repeat protein